MTETRRQQHWQHVYTTKAESEVSWYQESPSPSLDLIELAGATPGASIVDIGGGASRLVDALLDHGFQSVTVLDLSVAALEAAKLRLGNRSREVTWVAADVTTWTPPRIFDVWHDRAAFHFLTEPGDRSAYIARMRAALRVGGSAIIGTFALDGPERCSGLAVSRYDAARLGATLGHDFGLVDSRRHEHTTPGGMTQRFEFSTFSRIS
jgi:SAM-dependent methyltransferase